MSQLSQLNEQERIEEIIKLIRKKIKIAQFFGRLYFVVDDWFFAISLIIAVLSPFAFAMLVYFPSSVNIFGVISLVISAIGSLISLLRVTIRFGERGKFDLKKRVKYENLLNLYTFKLITLEQLIDLLKEIGIWELDEPQPK
jgi:hypothetical protein